MASTIAFPAQNIVPNIVRAHRNLCRRQCQYPHRFPSGRQPYESKAATTSSSGMMICEEVAAAPVPVPMTVPAKRARVSVQRTTSVAGMWRQVQGCDDWQGLLQPLHPVVRGEIVRYAELVDACYKAFDLDPSSKRYLNCKYGKERMLGEVGMAGAGYVVTKYIYAASDVTVPTQATTSGRSRWIGYVAVSTDEQTRRLGRRDILVSFRGTVTPAEWLANFMSSLAPARLDPCDPRPDVKVESGFLSLYTSADKTCRFGGAGSCREQLLREVSRLIATYSKKHTAGSQTGDISITLAGHSMGSALGLLFGYDLAELGLNRDGAGRSIPITVYSFGGPRVGNARFKERCDELGVKALRVANVRDPVTKLPGFFLNENSTRVLGGKIELPWIGGSCYAHVGVELALDFFKMEDLARVHDLRTYIALLKCAKKTAPQVVVKEEEKGILAKVKEFVGRQGGVGALPWQDAARQVGDLVQSLGF